MVQRLSSSLVKHKGEPLPVFLENVVPMVLNLASLRQVTPEYAGQRIRTMSAASASVAEIPFGGGEFIAMAGAASDDGGYHISTPSNFHWKRTVRGDIFADDFGAKPDWATDNADAIDKAMAFGHAVKADIHFTAGVYLTSRSPVVKSYSGIVGAGQEKTWIAKTTNSTFTLADFDRPVDCLVAVMAKEWKRDAVYGDNFAINCRVEGVAFRREGITGRENMPYYGLFTPYMANSIIRDVKVECGYIGCLSENVYLNLWERVGLIGLGVGQFVGFAATRTLPNGQFALSGTTNTMNNVSVVNYQIGFELSSMQYTNMINCAADGIKPMADIGETLAIAYNFRNPHGITLTSCGSEEVKGERLRITQETGAVYAGTMTVIGFQGQIVPENPIIQSPILRVQNNGDAWGLKVNMINSNFFFDSGTVPNQLAPYISNENGNPVRLVMDNCNHATFLSSGTPELVIR